MSKPTAIMLGLVAFAVLGGPAIFYGLLAMGEAGLFANAYDNFLLLVGAAIIFIVALWTTMLSIGARALAAKEDKEQLDG